MNAVDKLEAAIVKLERLKGNSGPWTLAGGGEWIFPIGITVAPDDGGVTTRQADLIVTLHRTIDPVLAILRSGANICSREGEYTHELALALASAILGES